MRPQMEIRHEALTVHEHAMWMDCLEEYVRAAKALAEDLINLG